MNGQVLSKESKKFLVGVIDDVLKLPLWAEPLDGPGANLVLNAIDKFGDKHIPDQFDPAINEIAMAAANQDYDTAAVKAGEVLDLLIDIPVVPDEFEKAIFVDGARLVVRMLQLWIANKKNQ